MEIQFEKATVKDFENLTCNIWEKADYFSQYCDFLFSQGHFNYRIVTKSCEGAKMQLINPYTNATKEVISFVSNDYLGFSKHPKVIEAGIEAVRTYGAGAGASPLIGGQLEIHDQLEKKISGFFGQKAAIIFSNGYAANSGTLSVLLGPNDIAILDMFVHASVTDGCQQTNKKYFLHNNMESLEMVLKQSKDKYNNKVVVVDGVYSQEGDVALLDQIYELTQRYGAFLVVDDAHGIGVLGNTGRGSLEHFNMLDKADMITGTFSKTFGSVGGFAVASEAIVNLLNYHSRPNIFSAAGTPQAAASAIKGIELIDEEPQWQQKINNNINYFRQGLETLNIDYGHTCSGVFPIRLRNDIKVKETTKFLFENGVYGNPILYPAVPRKLSRIRMSLSALHEKEDLDKALNLFEEINKKIGISRLDCMGRN